MPSNAPAEAIQAPAPRDGYTGLSIGVLLGGLALTALLIRRLGRDGAWLFLPQLMTAGLPLTDVDPVAVLVTVMVVSVGCVAVAGVAGRRDRPVHRRV